MRKIASSGLSRNFGLNQILYKVISLSHFKHNIYLITPSSLGRIQTISEECAPMVRLGEVEIITSEQIHKNGL